MPDNPLDTLDWSVIDAPDNSAAKASMARAVGSNPDQTAQALQLSKQVNLPPDVVSRNMDAVKQQAAMDSIDYDHILNQSPAAAKWLEDQHNANLVSDDPGMINKIGNTLSQIPEAFKQGRDQNKLTDYYGRMFRGEQLTPEEETDRKALEGAGLGDFKLPDTYNTPLDLAQMVPPMLQQYGRGAQGLIAGAVTGAAATAPIGALGGPFSEATIPAAATEGAIAGAWRGFAIGSIYEGTRQVINQTYGNIVNLKDENGNQIDPDVARGAAIMAGAATLPLTAAGLSIVADKVPGFAQLRQFIAQDGIKTVLANGGMRQASLQIGKSLAGKITMEGIIGAAQQAAQIGGEEFAKQFSDGNFQPITAGEAGDRLWQGATTNMLLSGLTAATTAPLDIYRSARGATTPEQVAQHVQNINDAVRTYPLFQRSPDRFNDLVQQLAPNDKFYVNADEAAKMIGSLAPEQQSALFNAVPDLHNEITTAAASGADVSIRKADYAAFIAPHPQADALVPHMKLDPADMSIAEREQQAAFLKANPEAVSDIQQQVSQIPQDATPEEMQASVQRIVQKSMQAAGIPNAEARMHAPLYAKTLSRFAAPFGQNAIDAMNQNLLEFHSVDERGTPIQKGSNFSTLLTDLQATRAGKAVRGADENTMNAVKNFGDKLDAAGISPELAQSMSSRELLDRLYPAEQPKGPIDQATDAVKTFTQNLLAGRNPLEAAQPEAVDETPNVLRQKYEAEPQKPAPDELRNAPRVPYNGTDSPEFKEWFGKSQVTDEHGEPLVVYHGTEAAQDFKQFLPGSFFSSSKEEASAYTSAGDLIRRTKMSGKYEIVKGETHAGQRFDYAGAGISEIDNPKVGKIYATDDGVFQFKGKGKWKIFDDLAPDYNGSYNEKDQTIGVISADHSEEAKTKVDEYEAWVKDRYPGGENGRVIPTYLSIKNPKELRPLDANKIGLRLGATRESIDEVISKLKAEGYDGIVTDSDEATMFPEMAEALGGIPKQYIPFDPTQVKSIFNSGEFSQVDPDILRQVENASEKERGYITFRKSEDFAARLKHVVVAFTSSKNFSTGVHEFAHWAVAQHRMFAEMAREQIANGNDSHEIKRIADDWEALKKAVGADSDKFTVEQEEKAAREFEAYMRKGEAPSEDLRRTFARMRDWLVKIYKDLRSLDVEMSPEIHGVFDRWLASDEQIAKVQDKNSALAQIAQNLGLHPDIVGRVADYVNSATTHAEEKVYRELSQEQKRRETKAYQEELDKMTDKIKSELSEKREYNLINYLKENKFKMLEGPETEGIDPHILGHGDDAIHPDQVADLYGYDSSMDMLRALKSTRPIDDAALSEARTRLLDKYPDMVQQGRIHNEAVDAILNDRTLIALDLMIKELGRSHGDNSRVGMKQFAMAAAQGQVDDMKLSNVNYSFRYDAARDTELRNALRASRDGDSNKAMLHLQRSMVNQIIYRSLEDFKTLKERADKLFDKIDANDKDLAATKDIDFIGAARYVLFRYGLGGQDFNIRQWLQDIQQRDQDVINDLSGLSLMVDTPPKEAKDLTVSEFRDIYNSIQNIYSTARQMKEGELNGKKFAVDQAVAELTKQMGPATKPLHDGTQLTAGNRFRNGLSSAKAALRRVEEWTRAMDGGDEGPFQKYIFGPAREAQTNYKAAREVWLGKFRDILKEHEADINSDNRIDTNMIKNDSLGRQARLVFRNQMEMIGFLLHTGNESNLDKLLGGYGIERQQFHDEITRLENAGTITEKHWKLVQKLWDLADGLKPLTQQAHKKLYGYRFDEIENAPVRTKYGVMRGGYWPAAIDRDQAANNKSVQEQIETTRQYMLATTRKGFIKNRADNYRQPLNTDLRLGSQHIDMVLKFVHLEPAVRDIARVINRNEFKELLKAHDFDAMDGMLTPWLGRFATQTMEVPVTAGDRSASMGRRVINAIRSSAMSQIIGYNAKVALQNIANMPVALYRVGPADMARAFAKVTVNPLGSIRDMKTASAYMNQRMASQAVKISQEINQIVEGKGNFSKGRDFLNRHSMVFMHALDGYLGAITWHGAYGDAVADGKADADAIAHADQIARQVMGSTDAVDISKFEASHPFVKMFTPFMSYFNEQANLTGTEFGNIMRQHGWAGSPKMFMAYIALIAAPAVIGDLIYGGLQNNLPGSDVSKNDGDISDWLAWMTGSQLKYMSAFVPGGGPIMGMIENAATGKQIDDRISISPVLSAGEGALKTGQELASRHNVDDGRKIRDVMSAMGFILHIPLGQPAKSISYAVDVNEGHERPDSPLSYIKGLVAGPPPKK